MLRKKVSLLLALVLVAMAFAACGQSSTPQSSTGQAASSTVSTPSTASSSTASTVPVDDGKPVEFTWFRPQLNRNSITYWNDALWIQELEKRMNVKITFDGPLFGATSAEYKQAVNILLNSGDYPEVLFYDWLNYSGGLAGAIEDGIVLNVSKNPDYWSQLPHWTDLIESNEFIRKTVTLDDGSSAQFSHVEETTNRQCYNGYALRGDWLEQTGKSVPTTIDELYDVLVAFKGLGKDIYPLTDESGFSTLANLAPAWGMKRNTPYPDPDTGKITYWTMYKDGQAFTDFVTTMNKWYNEGLIDPDFGSQDWAGRGSKITTGTSGFSFLLPQNYSSWKDALIAGDASLDGKAHFVGLVPLIGPAGKTYNTNGMKSWASASGNVITTAAEKDGKINAILKVIDYLYSPEGTDLNGWGVEGVSYTVNAQGQKEWTKLVTEDPDFSFGDAVFKYAIPTQGDWPKIMSYSAWLSQETKDPDAKIGHENYLKGDPGLSIPSIPLTTAESEEYNKIRADANTLIDEYFATLITGVRPLSDISTLFDQLDAMGMDRAMEIYQGAYDRYMAK